MLGDTASGTMGGGGVGAVKTGEEGVCKAVCQKSSRSKLGDFFGYHRSAIKGRRSGCSMVSVVTFRLSSEKRRSTAGGANGAHSLGFKSPTRNF